MASRTVLENFPIRIKNCKHGPMMYFSTDKFIGRALDLYGEWSEGESELFRQLLRPGMVVVDAGANIGVHTVHFSKAVGSTGRVVAIEPQRAIFHLLCGNLALNGCMNVEALRAALGSSPGTISVPNVDFTKEANFGGVALGQGTDCSDVAIIALDSLKLERCSLLKIDVEGMERAVLAGAERILSEHRPLLYVENDRAERSASLIQFLLERNYRLFWHLPQLFNPANYFGELKNVFGNTVSVNMLCAPTSMKIVVNNAREITSPQDMW